MPISNNYCLPKYPSDVNTPLISSRATSSRGYHNGAFFGSYQSYGTKNGDTPICAPPPVDLSYCGVMRSDYKNIAKGVTPSQVGVGAYQSQTRTTSYNEKALIFTTKGNQKYKKGFLTFK